MTLRIPLLVVLRVHLIVMAVQSGGLLDLEDLTLPTSPAAWFSEAVSTADPASDKCEEALVVGVSASSHAQHALW